MATITQARGLPTATDDLAQGVANIAEHGVTIHRQLIDPARRERLLDRVLEQAEMERKLGLAIIGGPGGPQDLIDCPPGDTRTPIYQNVEFLPNKGRVFVDLFMDPLLRGYAEGVLQGLPHKLWAMSGIISRKGLLKQKAHIDQNVVPPQLSTEMPAMLNVFICLSDFDEDMGATLIAPGTHRGPRPIWGVNEDSVDFFPAVAKAGDAIIWEGRTWHRGGPHTSDKTRYALPVNYCLYAVNPQVIYTSVLHDRVYKQLSPEELDVLGFTVLSAGYQGRLGPRFEGDTRGNVNGHTDYVPELHRPD